MTQKDYAAFILLCGIAIFVLEWPDSKFSSVISLLVATCVAGDYYSNKYLAFKLNHLMSVLIIGVCFIEIYQVLKYLI